MSIYATLADIGLRRFGDKELIEIRIQGVPPHIDHAGPKWAFLPPPVDPNGDVMRAVFFVEKGEEKGTSGNGQEYVKPLLVLTGQEYQSVTFESLLRRLEEALDVRYGVRPAAIVITGDGERKIYPDVNGADGLPR